MNMKNNHDESGFQLRILMFPIMIMLGITACYLGPAPVPAPVRPFSLIDLLIDSSSFPDNWEVIHGPVEAHDSITHAEELMHVFFGTDIEGITARHDIYRWSSVQDADYAYEKWFYIAPVETPIGWSYQSSVADKYHFECYDYVPSQRNGCVWTGLYQEYIVVFSAWMHLDRITLSDIENILATIDSIMDRNLNPP